MEYRVIRTGQSDDHFEHALFGGGRQKGAQNKNHKYLARAWWQNKWRYAYTQAEVKALQMLGKTGSLKENQRIKKLERESATAKKEADKAGAKIKRNVTRAVDDARSEVASRANTARVTASRAADSVRNAVGDTARKVSRSAREAVDDVRSGVTAKQVAIRAETARNDARNVVSRASEAVKSTASKASKSASKAAKKGKAKASQVLNSLKSKGTETISSAKSSVEKGKNKANEILNKVATSAKSAASKASEAVKDTAEKAGNTAKETASKASSAVKAVAEVPGNIKKTVNEIRNYHEKVDAERAGAEREFRERSKIHAENFDKYHDPNSSAEQKAEADKALNDNWKPMWEADIKKRESKQAQKSDDYKKSIALDKTLDTIESASAKGKAAAEKLLNRASDAARSAAEKVANSETGRKISDAAERVADRVSDIKESAEHKAYASEMKRKYGADSLHYKDAQALLDHDKAVDDLAKARDKYGVNSSEYKAAMRKEQSTRDAMDEVHEQNLYSNNAQYKKISDQASALGSYIDNMDARGGPQTAEGKANYRKAVQDLERLEAQLERMWNEDWE